MGPRTFFGPAPKKCARPFVCAALSTTKPGPRVCARVIGGFMYEVSFVHLPGRGDLTCTPGRRARRRGHRRRDDLARDAADCPARAHHRRRIRPAPQKQLLLIAVLLLLISRCRVGGGRCRRHVPRDRPQQQLAFRNSSPSIHVVGGGRVGELCVAECPRRRRHGAGENRETPTALVPRGDPSEPRVFRRLCL